MDKKKILVLSEYFAPLSSIASIRFTKILKYLSRTNKYHFTVIARKSEDTIDNILINDLEELKANADVYYINVMDNYFDRARKTFIKNRKGDSTQNTDSSINAIKFKPYNQATKKEKLYKLLNTLKYIYNENIYVNRGWKIINTFNNKFDCIISTYGDAGTHMLAIKYKKLYKEVDWIADYRDPALVYYRPPFFNSFYNKIVEKTNRYAKYITGVTKGALNLCQQCEKTRIILNGYDKEDLLYANGENVFWDPSKFNISYTGRMYEGKSNASYLFEVLSELGMNEEIDLHNIRINYVGSNCDLLKKQAQKYGLEKLIFNYGYLQRNKTLWIQKKSDLLLVLSWNDEEEEDVLTGKFMEYLMVEKNILAIVMGSKTDSSIYTIISNSNAGFCFEEARNPSEYDKLREYLKKAYYIWEENGEFFYNGKKDVIEKYDYINIASEYEKLINH